MFLGSPGKMASHPNLGPLMVEHYNEIGIRLGEPKRLSNENVKVIQQRTLQDRPHPVDPHDSGRVALSTCLALMSPFEDLTGTISLDTGLLLVQFQAIHRLDQSGDGNWQAFSSRAVELGSPPLKPYVALGAITEGFFILSMLATHPDVATVRVELADGRIFEDQVEDDTLVIFMPHESATDARTSGTFRILDQSGREIIVADQSISPEVLHT